MSGFNFFDRLNELGRKKRLERYLNEEKKRYRNGSNGVLIDQISIKDCNSNFDYLINDRGIIIDDFSDADIEYIVMGNDIE